MKNNFFEKTGWYLSALFLLVGTWHFVSQKGLSENYGLGNDSPMMFVMLWLILVIISCLLAFIIQFFHSKLTFIGLTKFFVTICCLGMTYAIYILIVSGA